MKVDTRFALTALVICLLATSIIGTNPASAFYNPPGNVPPGPPPNYNQIDTSYFKGAPDLPDIVRDSGGFYIWYDNTGAWNVANRIYRTTSNSQDYHGSVLASLSAPPTPGVNVFANSFELLSDGSDSYCYKQNDRWGWYQWDENLYEIWWDVSTRNTSGQNDSTDFLKVSILGCAIDFNVWSDDWNGHHFGPQYVFLGESMIRLSDVPGFSDTFYGLNDPYADAGHSGERNISVFTRHSGNGSSYNKFGVINPGQTYPCDRVLGSVLCDTYGQRFSGAFTYEGNGIEFSAGCVYNRCYNNTAPILQPPYTYNIFQCSPTQFCFNVDYIDDGNFRKFQKLSGPGNIDSLTGVACFTPGPTSQIYNFLIMGVDSCGISDTATYSVTVGINSPPIVNCPGHGLQACDINMTVCSLVPINLPGFTWGDPDNNIISVTPIGGILHGDTITFTPIVGVNTLGIIARDACGFADTCITTVGVTLNSRPDAVSPINFSQFVCNLNEIRLPGFTATDVDNNLVSKVLTGGTLHGDTAYFTPVVGANTLRLVATDACGLTDTSITVVTINLNHAPDAVSPANSSLFVCSLTEIRLPGFTATDVDNNLVSKVLTGGTLHGDTAYFTPVVGANTLRLVATDACGLTDTSITVVTINLNHAPDAVSPANSSLFVCSLTEIRLPGFTATDVDNNLVSKVLTGGTLHGDTAYFTPVVGANTLRLVATDACGLTDTSITVVTINLNHAPDAVSPANSNQFVCALTEIRLPGFTATDVDNNLVSKVLTGGTLHGDTAYFTPVVGANTLRLVATDACGLTDTSITIVTINLNHAPDAVSPANSNQFVCALTEIRLPGFTATDVDNNLVSKVLTGGTLHGDTAYFTPVVGANTLRLVATDACGLTDTSITIVTINLNHAPDAVSPANSSLFVCSLTEIRLPGFTATDVDNNLVSKVLTGGTLHGDTAYFTPVVGANTLRLVATDACGLTDTSITIVTINLNHAPDAVSPANSSLFVCSLTEIRLPGFTATDVDNNLVSKVLTGGTLHGDTAYFTPVVGANTLRLVATDACGFTDTSITIVTINLNHAPDAVSPANSSLFVCSLTEIRLPGFTATDVDNNLVSKVLTGGTLHGDTAYFTPVVGANTLRLVATDACGLTDTSITIVTINLNHAPDAVSPANSSLFVCSLTEIRLPGFTATDVDNNLVSKVLTGGTLHGDTAYFTPVVGANTLRLVATDACGLTDTSITVVTINLNHAPDAVSPANSNQFVCALTEIRLPGFTATDVDNNLVSKVLTGGTLHGDTAYFTPVVGANTLRLVATDACGLTDTSITIVTINLNHAPDAVSPANSSLFVCSLTEIRLPGFTATDVDNNLVSKVLTGGTLHGDTAYFTPVVGANTLRLVATDACGLTDTSITIVTINLNHAPDAVSPANSSLFVCSLTEIRLPGFTATDVDNNLVSKVLTGGTLHGDTAYFTPVVGANTLRLVATDACGLTDTSITVVTINLNHAPDAVSPANSSLFVCSLTEIRLPGFTATDVDNNLVSKVLTGGTLHGDTAYFTPVVGANTLRLVATDACGLTDTSITVVTINLNHAPDAVSPANSNQFVCALTEIRLPGFTATDVDNNLVSKVLTGGTLHGDTAYFTPVVGANTLRLVATDACGLTDTSITIVTINLNHAPDAVSPANSNQFVCALTEIRLPGFTATDVDNNLVSKVLTGGTLHGDTAYFTPVVGANTLRLVATDACGLTDTSITIVTINLNHAPDAVSPANSSLFVCSLTEIRLPGFTATDVDNNLVSKVLTGGTLHGDTAYFTPVVGANTLRLVATDACGLTDTSITVVTITLNQAPLASSPSDQSQFVCALNQICLPGFAASDPDNNLISRVLEGGILQGDTACFTPIVGVNTLRLIATDACGAADTAVTVVTITANHAPVAASPVDTAQFVCALNQICLLGFTASDVDGNLVSKTLVGGILHGDTACFTPVVGVNTLRLIATDACGAADTNITNVTITLNSAPLAQSPNDTSLVVPNLALICLGGFTGSDSDDNLISKVVIGGTLSGDSVCFTPVQGINTLTFICIDACGAADTSITHVTVNVAISLALVGGIPPEFTEEIADSFFVSITGGDPGSLGFTTEFTDHAGYPDRYSTTLIGSNIRMAMTFDYLDEFSSAQSPFAYQVIASDGHSADTLDLSLIVHDNNRIPTISSINDTTIIVSSTLAFTVNGNDLDLDNTLVLTKIGGPGIFNSTPGFPPVSGSFSWTPVVGDIGLHQVIFGVNDGRGGAAGDTVNIHVRPSGIDLQVYGGGGIPPIFTEEAADSFFVTLGGYDPTSLTFSASFPGHAGAPARYSASLEGNLIKVVATFDYLGEFSNAHSPFAYKIIASDNFSADTLDLSLIVNDNNRIPEIAVGSIYTVMVDHTVSFVVTGNDLDTDNSLNLNKVSGPGNFAGASGPPPVSALFTWTPTSADLPGSPYMVRFAISDGRGGVDTANVTITVFPDGVPVIEILYSPNVFHEGQLDSVVFRAHDPDGDPMGGFGYKFMPPSPDSTFSGVSFRIHGDSAFIRSTFDYLGPWSSSGSPFPVRLLAYSTRIMATIDTAFLNVPLTVLNTNRKPDLIVNGPHSVVAGNNVDLSLQGTDVDTDDILTLTASNLPAGSHFDDHGNGLGSFSWLTAPADSGIHTFRFFINDNRNTSISRDTVLWDLQVSLPDTTHCQGLDSALLSIDHCALAVAPGSDVTVGIRLNNVCPVGGFEILIATDPTALTLYDVDPTERINYGWEYFNWVHDPLGPGTARFIWIYDTPEHGAGIPCAPGIDPIINLNFHVASGLPFSAEVPIYFAFEGPDDYSSNTLSDITGNLFIHPRLDSGCVYIADPGLFRGDPNMNCFEYEIADAVLVANRLILGAGVWAGDDYMDNLPGPDGNICLRHQPGNDDLQEAAADLNGNGHSDIADLVRFINIINGFVYPKLDPAIGRASFYISNGAIRISSDAEVGGVLLRIAHDGDIGAPVASNGMQLQSNDAGGVLTVLIYSISGHRIPAGNQTLFTLTGPGAITEVSAADMYGEMMESRIGAPLPTEFAVKPNYPNPFNAKTSIGFSLPTESDVTVNIYSITGQLVETLKGHFAAGADQSIIWDGSNVASGVYFAKVWAGSDNRTLKMTLLK